MMIENNNIVIRAIESGDIEPIMKWNKQSERGEFQEFTLDSRESLLKQLQNGELFSERFQMLMIESPMDTPVGLIFLNFFRPGVVRIGLVISADARNTGLGKIVTNEITDYLFNNYPIVRIEADTDANNIPAQKVLEISGFEKEGVLRKYRYHHGKYNDSVLYSKIKE